MKIIPLYDKVGYYGFFFADMSEFETYASKIDWTICDAFIKINPHETLRITSSGQIRISNFSLHKYLNPPLPFWMKDSANYSCVIQNRYMDIRPKTAEVITTMNVSAK